MVVCLGVVAGTVMVAVLVLVMVLVTSTGMVKGLVANLDTVARLVADVGLVLNAGIIMMAARSRGEDWHGRGADGDDFVSGGGQ